MDGIPAPEPPPWLVVLIASSDGVRAISRVVADLPRGFPAAVIAAQHRSAMVLDLLADILRMRAKMPVERIGHGQPIEAGTIYVGRPDLHLTIDHERRFKYIDGTRIKHVLSSADPLLLSASIVFKSRLIAVVMTGRGSDAAGGIAHVHAHGGTVMVQDPATVAYPDMPNAALRSGPVEAILPLEEIAAAIIAMVDPDVRPRESRRQPALQG